MKRFEDLPSEHQDLLLAYSSAYDDSVEFSSCLKKLCPEFPSAVFTLIEEYARCKHDELNIMNRLKGYGYSEIEIMNLSCAGSYSLAE